MVCLKYIKLRFIINYELKIYPTRYIECKAELESIKNELLI